MENELPGISIQDCSNDESGELRVKAACNPLVEDDYRALSGNPVFTGPAGSLALKTCSYLYKPDFLGIFGPRDTCGRTGKKCPALALAQKIEALVET